MEAELYHPGGVDGKIKAQTGQDRMEQIDKLNHRINWHSLYNNRYIEQISTMEAELYQPRGVDGHSQEQTRQNRMEQTDKLNHRIN